MKIIAEKKISSARRSQLDLRSNMSSISSLTPSVLNSPLGSKKISPTQTPPHTPEESLPGSPDDKTDAGYVASFFSSLKAAIYGQQRKQHRSTKFKQKLEFKRNELGILESVDEDEPHYNEKEGTPMSLPGLSTIDEKSSKKSSSGAGAGGQLSDFDVRYLGVLDDFDELEEITPEIGRAHV